MARSTTLDGGLRQNVRFLNDEVREECQVPGVLATDRVNDLDSSSGVSELCMQYFRCPPPTVSSEALRRSFAGRTTGQRRPIGGTRNGLRQPTLRPRRRDLYHRLGCKKRE